MYVSKPIDPLEYAGVIAKALDPGVLLTTRAGEKINTMTIGWGTVGVEWGRPVFIAFVRSHRFTHELLEESGEFTVNVPVGPFDKRILGLCGTRTGRDCDKFALAGLTAVPGQKVAAPAIAQLPLTLECQVVEMQQQPYGLRVLGRIVNVMADEKVLDSDGRIDAAKLNAFAFDQMRNGYYAMGQHLDQAWHAGAPLMKD